MRRPLIDRLMEKVRVDADGCWVWTGSCFGGNVGKNGVRYGRISRDGKQIAVHRASYEAHVGPIPAGLVIDHLCRNTFCINPAHLEAVTQQENVLRGLGAMKSHCPHGHELSGSNLRIQKRRTKASKRICATCHVEQNRAWRARRAHANGASDGA